jgi:hypothetical protein
VTAAVAPIVAAVAAAAPLGLVLAIATVGAGVVAS